MFPLELLCVQMNQIFLFFFSLMRLLMTGSDSKRNFDSSESAY